MDICQKVMASVEKVAWMVLLLRLWWNLLLTQEQLSGWKILASWLNSRCWNRALKCFQCLCSKTLVWEKLSTCLLETSVMLPREPQAQELILTSKTNRKQKEINLVPRWKKKRKKTAMMMKMLSLLHSLLRKKNPLKKLMVLTYLNMRVLKMKAMNNTRRRISRKHLNFTIKLFNLNLLKYCITTIKQLPKLNSSS